MHPRTATRVATLTIGLVMVGAGPAGARTPADLLAAAAPESAAPNVVVPKVVVPAHHPAHHPAHVPAFGRVRGPGHGQDAGHEQDAESRAERDVALAATWHLDPALLEPAPTDSEATAAVRLRLAVIDARLGDVMAAYDDARAHADAAAARAREARVALEAAREAQRAAAARYRADRALMLSVVNEAYTTSQVGALGLLLTADSDEDLVQGLTVLQQFSDEQSDAVLAAERSRERLRAATVAVAAAEQDAQDRLDASRVALAVATDARTEVLTEVRTARSLLEDSVLADQALRDSAANGYRGALSFPLPDGAAYVDQHNFGHKSRHWASVHTGDDFSTACGTPVLAVNDGTVLVRTDQGWSGPWLVMVSTGDGGLTTWYAHMQALTVVPGQEVHAGDQIGVVGQRGNATGCHLHLEVHPTGGSIYQDDIDPSTWMQTVGIYPGD